MTEDTKNISLQVPYPLYRKLVIATLIQQRTLKSLLLEILTKALANVNEGDFKP